MTNGDVIRSMQNDVLAEFLMGDEICEERQNSPPFCNGIECRCRECIYDWLNEETGKRMVDWFKRKNES